MAHFEVGGVQVSAAGYARWNGSVFSTLEIYNVSSLADGGTGYYGINWNVDMNSTTYAWVGTSHYGGGQNDTNVVEEHDNGTQAATLSVQSMQCLNSGTSFVAGDAEVVSVIAFQN
jgi:hypothetical protein